MLPGWNGLYPQRKTKLRQLYGLEPVSLSLPLKPPDTGQILPTTTPDSEARKPWSDFKTWLQSFGRLVVVATMATFRRFRPDDVDKFSKCNLDPLTETYELAFYLQYHAKWPALFQVCEDMNGNIIGYSGCHAGGHRPGSSRMLTVTQSWES